MGAEQPERTKDATGNSELEAQRLQEHARNSPLVPPSDGACPINRLPPEILSLIFEHGTAAAENPEDVDEEGPMTWGEFSERHAEDEEGSGERTGRIQEEKGEQHETGVDGEEGSDADDKSSECESDVGVHFPFQLIISQVCRHWRTVALETPSLWTRIKVSCMDRPPYERVNAFLDRSKSLPLEICVDSESPDDLSDDEDPPAELSKADLEKLFTLLVPHVPRWGSIEVHVACYEHMYTFLKTLSDPSVPPASQLQVLRLYHHEEFDGHITRFPEPDFSDHFTLFNGSAPRLQNVSLWGVHVDWTQSWLHSPNLVELELAYHTPDVRPDWPTFSAMLRATAPRLEKLCLESSGPSGSPYEWIVEPDTPEWNVDANNPILLPKLIQLELAFIPPLEVISLLRKLCMPSLKVLALNFNDGDYTDLVTYLARPTATAATKAIGTTSTIEQPRSLLGGLESLKIAGLPCSEQSVERMYNELVNLDALNLSMHHLPPPFFGNLRPQPTPTLEGSGPPDTTVSYRVLLPRLATLFVSDVPGDHVRRFVHERQWVGAPLRMVFVEEDTYVAPEDESWLKENLRTICRMRNGMRTTTGWNRVRSEGSLPRPSHGKE